MQTVSCCLEPKVRGGKCENCGQWIEDLLSQKFPPIKEAILRQKSAGIASPQVAEYCPGNGTRYVVVVSTVEDPDAQELMGYEEDKLAVLYLPDFRKGGVVAIRPQILSWDVSTALGLNKADGEAITHLLAEWFNVEAVYR